MEAARGFRGLQHVPPARATRRICPAAVEEDGASLNDVPEALKDSAICLAAVEEHGMALEYVPEAERTRDLCLAAVQESGMVPAFVPEALKETDLCLAVAEHAGKRLEALDAGDGTQGFCLAAAKLRGRRLGRARRAAMPDRSSACLCALRAQAHLVGFLHGGRALDGAGLVDALAVDDPALHGALQAAGKAAQALQGAVHDRGRVFG